MYTSISHRLERAGPSGAGKTTLLHALAWRKDANIKMKGTFLVAGRPRSQLTFTQQDSILAEQDPNFTACMTVTETLDLYCRLQRPGYAASSKEAQAAVLNMLLTLVGLWGVQHSRVSKLHFADLSSLCKGFDEVRQGKIWMKLFILYMLPKPYVQNLSS